MMKFAVIHENSWRKEMMFDGISIYYYFRISPCHIVMNCYYLLLYLENDNFLEFFNILLIHVA